MPGIQGVWKIQSNPYVVPGQLGRETCKQVFRIKFSIGCCIVLHSGGGRGGGSAMGLSREIEVQAAVLSREEYIPSRGNSMSKSPEAKEQHAMGNLHIALIYFHLHLECDPRDKGVILMVEGKGNSTAGLGLPNM